MAGLRFLEDLGKLLREMDEPARAAKGGKTEFVEFAREPPREPGPHILGGGGGAPSQQELHGGNFDQDMNKLVEALGKPMLTDPTPEYWKKYETIGSTLQKQNIEKTKGVKEPLFDPVEGPRVELIHGMPFAKAQQWRELVGNVLGWKAEGITPAERGLRTVEQGYNKRLYHGTSSTEKNPEYAKLPQGSLEQVQALLLHQDYQAIPFTEFRMPEDEIGVHFGSRAAANHFAHNLQDYAGRVMPVMIRANNPLRLPDLGSWHTKKMRKGLIEAGFKEDEVPDIYAPISDFRKFLLDKGFDSIVYRNMIEDPGHDSYILFKESATHPQHIQGARLQWADFDPKKITGANVLWGALGAAPAVLLTGGDKAKAQEGEKPFQRGLGPNDNIGYGLGKYPPTLKEFRRIFGREPMTDTEVELYGPTGQKHDVPWHRGAPSEAAPPMSENITDPSPEMQHRTAANLALRQAFNQEEQQKKLLAEGRRRLAERTSVTDFDDPFGGKAGLSAAGKGAGEMAENISAMRGMAQPSEVPSFVKPIVQHSGEWSDDERRAWQVLTSAGGLALATLNTTLGLMQAANPVHGLGAKINEATLNLGKKYIDRQDLAPEQKEAGKTLLDFAVGFGFPGWIGKAKTVAKTATGAQLAQHLQQQRATQQMGITTAFRQIFSPASRTAASGMGGGGVAAGALIREHTGQAARDTAISIAKLREDHAAGMVSNFFKNNEKRFNQMRQFEQFQLLDYIEGRSKGKVLFDPSLQPFADEFKRAMELRKNKFQATSSLAHAQMLDDYATHYWKDVNAAKAFVANWSKQGGGGMLKKRALPTLADGLRAGLDPITNPFELAVMYITNADKYIAHNRIVDAAKNAGEIHYAIENGKRSRVLEANGYVKLKGRLSTKQIPPGSKFAGATQVAYASDEFAQVYNNFISKGIYDFGPRAGRVYEAARGLSNYLTAAELGLSGFHAITMSNEAWIADVAKAVSNIVAVPGATARGHFLDAMKLLSRGTYGLFRAPVAPARLAAKGHKFEQIYLDRAPGNAGMRQILDLFTSAGGRAVGRKHAPDYRFTAYGSFFDALKKGTRLFEGGVFRSMGRIFETVAQPLFDKYIPKLKNGAVVDLMQEWMLANPQSSRSEQLAVMRRIIDSVDNRFGEMIQDNIFWHNGMKQAAMLGMRSYSWNLGTVREIAGGALKALRHPSRMSITSKDYDPRTAYVVALPIVALVVGNIYQYLKTGKKPEGTEDALHAAIAPRTGGTAPGVGGRGRVPERTMIPGYMKDVIGWYEDPWREMMNKRATWIRLIGEVGSGTDWRGDPIVNQDPRAPRALMQWFDYAINNVGPFSLRQVFKGNPPGTGLSNVESLMGMRPAGAALQDPRGLAQYKKYQAKVKFEAKRRREQRMRGFHE